MVNPSECLRKGKKSNRIFMKNLKSINSRDYLIKACPYQFKGTGKFPGTTYISKRMPYLLSTHKTRSLLLKQEVTFPVTETMDWVSSLAYSWTADGDFRTCLNPTHLSKAIGWDHYRIPILGEITHELVGGWIFILPLHSS